MKIKPFKAITPTPELAQKVSCPPYDVIGSEEARNRAIENPSSFLRIIKPEIDLPPDTPPYDADVYKKAAENFELFLREGWLQRQSNESLFLYQLETETHSQIGLVCVCHVQDYEENIIKKHEKTRKAPEDDRTKHIMALKANTGPVFLTYRDQPTIDELVTQACKPSTLFDFQSEDKVRHRIWEVLDSSAFVKAFEAIPSAYIADGHHRSASALRASHEIKNTDTHHSESDEHHWFLAVLFPVSQLKILAYNRCVKDLNGVTPEVFIDKLSPFFTVNTLNTPAIPAGANHIHMYLKHQWYDLTWNEFNCADPVSLLSVSVLQNQLLDPVLNIKDPRNDSRLSFTGGHNSMEVIMKRVDKGEAAVGFLLFPTTAEELLSIADADKIMPPKSTWFEPKLRSGLFVHSIAEH